MVSIAKLSHQNCSCDNDEYGLNHTTSLVFINLTPRLKERCLNERFLTFYGQSPLSGGQDEQFPPGGSEKRVLVGSAELEEGGDGSHPLDCQEQHLGGRLVYTVAQAGPRRQVPHSRATGPTQYPTSADSFLQSFGLDENVVEVEEWNFAVSAA